MAFGFNPLFGSGPLILYRDDRHGYLAAVCQAQLDVAHSHGMSPFRRPTGEMERGAVAGLPANLDLLPPHASADACPQGLRASLLCGKARGEAFGRVFLLAQ